MQQGLVVPPLFCSVIGNKLDFSSFSGSVVGCNLEYKRSFLLSSMHPVERRGVAVLCLVFITTCLDGSPRRTTSYRIRIFIVTLLPRDLSCHKLCNRRQAGLPLHYV